MKARYEVFRRTNGEAVPGGPFGLRELRGFFAAHHGDEPPYFDAKYTTFRLSETDVLSSSERKLVFMVNGRIFTPSRHEAAPEWKKLNAIRHENGLPPVTRFVYYPS